MESSCSALLGMGPADTGLNGDAGRTMVLVLGKGLNTVAMAATASLSTSVEGMMRYLEGEWSCVHMIPA